MIRRAFSFRDLSIITTERPGGGGRPHWRARSHRLLFRRILAIDELAELGVGEVEKDATVVSGRVDGQLGGEFGVDRVRDCGDCGEIEEAGLVATGEVEMEDIGVVV